MLPAENGNGGLRPCSWAFPHVHLLCSNFQTWSCLSQAGEEKWFPSGKGPIAEGKGVDGREMKEVWRHTWAAYTSEVKTNKKTTFVYSCDSWFLRVKKSQDTEASSFPPWLTLHGAGCSDWEQCLAISALACPPGQLFRTTKSNNWTVSWEERSGNVGAGTTARRAAKQLSSCKCYEYRTQPTGHLLWLFPWQPESSPGTMAAFSETLYFILR